MKTIKKEVARGSQSVTYTEILKSGSHKLRIQIKSDSYDFQCYARIQVLDEKLKWNSLDSIHFDKMKTQPKLCYLVLDNVEVTVDNMGKRFTKDRDKLLEVANQLI